MALTDQPYLPLYVDDWMNNNKLKMCSPSAHGLMIVILCIMHKEAEYGTILLKQKFRQTSKQIKNFALQIAKLSPFDTEAIEEPLNELISEGALKIEDDYLICPRMVKDCQLSVARSNAGKTGGNITKNKKASDKAKPQAKCVSNSGIDTDNGNESENVNVNGFITDKGKGGTGEKPKLVYPFDTESFKQELLDLKDKGYAYARELMARKSITKEELEDLKNAQVKREKIYGEGKELNRRQAEDARQLNEELKAQREAQLLEQREKNKKIIEDAINRQKQLLSLFTAENAARTKNLNEQIRYEEQISARSLAILKQELNAKEITLTEYAAAEKNIKTTQAANVAQITASFARAELDLYLEQHQTKIKAGETLTAAMLEQENIRLAAVKQRTLATLELEKGTDRKTIERKRVNNIELTLADIEYQKEAARIEREFDEQAKAGKKALADADTTLEEKKKTDKEAARAKQAEDVKLRYELELAEADNQYETQKILEDQRYEEAKGQLEQRKQDGLITEQQYNTLMEAEDKKLADNKKAIEQAVVDNKLDLASSTFGSLAAIMGKESAAGKAMAVAQATIDTYKSAVSAYGAMANIPVVGPALGAVAAAAAVAAGIANVKKITSTKPPKAEKGALFNIGGNRHSAGGTLFTGADGTQFEAEQGELIGVMNRNAARHFMAFNNAFPAGGASAPNYFAGGGIVSREIAQQTLNTDELAMKIAKANSMLPPPVVAVQDIITQGNDYVRVRDAANF